MSRKLQRTLLIVVVMMGLAILSVYYYVSTRVSVSGPFTLEEAIKNQIPFPLYRVAPQSAYSGQLKPLYYYISRDDELLVETYFLENQANEWSSSAKMVAHSLLKAGPSPLKEKVQITWASTGEGYTCKVSSSPDTNRSPLKNSSYQSCLYWMGADKLQYELYTVWTEDETVQFVNALVKANQ